MPRGGMTSAKCAIEVRPGSDHLSVAVATVPVTRDRSMDRRVVQGLRDEPAGHVIDTKSNDTRGIARHIEIDSRVVSYTHGIRARDRDAESVILVVAVLVLIIVLVMTQGSQNSQKTVIFTLDPGGEVEHRPGQ